MEKFRLCILLVLLVGEVSADTWPPPSIEDYYSVDSTFRLRIYPQHIPEKYYDWLAASTRKKKRFVGTDTLVTPSYAQLYKKTTRNGDSLIWEQQLINRIAPVTALVSNNGKYVVTLDNWYSMGYGVDVMVSYNEKGHLIKRHMLEDISPFPINTYDISISSIWWRCGQKFIDNERILICFRDSKEKVEERIYDLSERRIVPPK